MIYTINNCIRAFGYTNFDNLIADMGSVDNLREYVRANGYADIAVAEDTELLLVDVNGKTWHTGCYGAVIEPPKPYLCFTSTGDSTVAMQQNGTPNTSANKVIQYKLNDGQWQTWDLSAVTLSDGAKMYIKSDDEISMAESISIYKKFVMTGSISASGNIMSLLNFSDTLTDYAFCKLFIGCSALKQVPELPATILAPYCYYQMFGNCYIEQTPELPATTLAPYCYNNMFYGCFRLKTAPVLPATTLAPYCYYDMFNGCSSLTNTPELPATALAPYCYKGMFMKCTSLTQAPELPATTLADSCYSSMFNGCSSLTNAPELPATTLAKECYYGMFYICTSLENAPELHATTLAQSCCEGMFYKCTSLTAAPALHATTLAEKCYNNMFGSCSSLTAAPAMPATTLAPYCYGNMFKDCTSLVNAPELPATELVSRCYNQMFYGCTKLNYVKALFLNASKDYYQGFWLHNVSPTGTFIKSKDATWTNDAAGIPSGWTVQTEGGVTPEPEPERDYLCFTSTGDSTVAMTQNGTPNTSANKVIQYKLNAGQWQTWDLSAVTLHDGDKMYLKSDDIIQMGESNTIYKQFVMTGSIAASGNTMSLLNFSTTLTNFAFYGLFSGCTSLVQAPALPVTTLTEGCYENMFEGCTSLTQAPALPATTLERGCYSKMFRACTSLTTAPELPATILYSVCYYYMFEGCTNLNYVKAMFINIAANSVGGWLNNVSSTGTFVKNSAATWTNTDAGIPSGWTVQTASPDK